MTRLLPAGGSMATVSMAGIDGDYQGGYRLESSVAGGAREHLHVLSLDEAVSSATMTGDREATIELADGRTAVVSFGAAGVDGALQISGGAPSANVTLGAGVATLPE